MHSWHTGLCVEGVPLRGTSILRLRRAPFGFIGRRPSGQARRLFGWSQTRESLCRTPVSKGLLVSYAIPYFHFSVCSLHRIRARQRSLDFASVDDTEWRFAQLAYWSLRGRGASSCPLSCAVSKGCSVSVSYRNVLLYAPIKKIPPELVLQRDLTNNSLSTVRSSPFHRFFWRYRAIPGGCFPERGR